MDFKGRTRLYKILLSLCRAVTKSIPVVGPGTDQILFGTSDASAQEEMLSILREIHVTFKEQIEQQKTALEIGEKTPKDIIEQIFLENPTEVSELSFKLDRLRLDVLVLLISYLNKLTKKQNYTEEELGIINESYDDWILKLKREFRLFESDLQIIPHLIENFSEISLNLSKLLSTHKLNTFREFQNLIRFHLSFKEITTLMNYIKWSLITSENLYSQLLNDIVDIPWRYTIDFSEIHKYAHAHEHPERLTPFVIYMIDNSDDRFLVLPGSLSELHSHFEFVAESLLGFDNFIPRFRSLAIPKLFSFQSKVLSRFAKFIDEKMMRLEEIKINVEPEITIAEQATKMLNQLRPEVRINNANDAMDISILLKMHSYRDKNDPWWVHVTSSSLVEKVLRKTWGSNSLNHPLVKIYNPQISAPVIGPAEYVLNTKLREKAVSAEAFSGYLRGTRDISKNLLRNLYNLRSFIDTEQSTQKLKKAFNPQDVGTLINSVIYGIEEFRASVGKTWLNLILDEVNLKWSREFGSVLNSIDTHLRYQEFDNTSDIILKKISEIYNRIQPMLEYYSAIINKKNEMFYKVRKDDHDIE